MINLPFLICCIKFFFSGMAVYAVVQYAYIYMKRPGKEVLAPLIISIAASLFILGDTFVSVFTVMLPHEGAAWALSFFRESMPLVILFLAPYYLGRLFDLGRRLKSVNVLVMYAGAAAAGIILMAGIVSPGLMVKGPLVVSDIHAAGAKVIASGPLVIARDVLILLYLVYSIIIILISEIRRPSLYPVRNIVIGLGIACYIALNYLYTVIFSNRNVLVISNQFPYMALAVAVFMVFMALALIELFTNSIKRVENLHDNITGVLYIDPELEVPNTAAFRRDLQTELFESADRNKSFSLVFLDIDDFQNINESYGETVGDVILWMLSKRLMDNFADSANFYRMGGDEFVFLLRKIKSEEAAADFATKIKASLRNPFVVSEASYTVTVSMAILVIPRDGNDLDTIMDNAYITIRSVKKTKNAFAFFKGDLVEGATRKIFAVNLLRNCIAGDEFVLFYQPVVDVDEKIVYAEGLLRCTNGSPDIGGPDKFIPLVEKAGMMKELDNLVVGKAFYDMEMKIKKRIGISINLSANQLCDPAYGDFLSSFARQHGIEPGRVILEITESTLVENMQLARENLARLKNSGFLIAIDDFGKGFSSLSYLAELPLDILKIDMAFVHTVPGDGKKETMAKYIMELGRSLGLKVLAEGFELPEQVDFFKKNGCALFQGYYFSRPIPLPDLLAKYLD